MKNNKTPNLESRVQKARLEADVKEIKAMLQALERPGWKAIVGTFANDPAFDEVRKITDELREKERRKARRKRVKHKVS